MNHRFFLKKLCTSRISILFFIICGCFVCNQACCKENATMTTPTDPIKADYSWYEESAYIANGNKYILTDANDLMGFAIISQQDTFEGKTVQLGANITVNDGTAAEMEARANDSDTTNDPITWIPIGDIMNGRKFAGTFDGQNYTIRGLYRKSDQLGVALFSETSSSSTVQNLRMEDCYFHYDGYALQSDGYVKPGYVASVAAYGNGAFKNIYSSATIISEGNCAGGIVASVCKEVSDNHIFEKCWFDGTVTLKKHEKAAEKEEQYSFFAGGILGQVVNDDIVCQMFDCLNTGTIIGSINHVGGLCGYVADSGTLSITNSLNAGSVTGNTNYGRICSIVGHVEGEIKPTDDQRSTLRLLNVYSLKGAALDDTYHHEYTSSQDKAEYLSGTVTVLKKTKLKGERAKKHASALFATSGVWKSVTGSTPILDFTWKQ